MNVSIESATASDVQFVAWTVLTALDMTSDDLSMVARCCADDNTIYSWRRAFVAKVDGKVVGCLIAYDGAHYEKWREYTWNMLWDDFDPEYVKNVAYETSAGEFYLDSMAVLPEYRGYNIGKSLIFHAINKASKLCFKRFGLIVDVHKPHLFDYYRSIGFNQVGDIEFFGHIYNRMSLTF